MSTTAAAMNGTTSTTTRLGTIRITPWTVLFGLLMLAGVYVTYLRFMYGIGSVTNLSDSFPWGIWIGFDILCGVGLAAGGFTLVATVHIFNLEKYKPVLRPAILTAFLGYSLVVMALMFDLGRPDRIWHPLIMWNPHSVMFEVGWCVMLYSTVLALEFSPAVFEKFGWQVGLKYFRIISVPLMIAGVILSTLHQSSLGSLYLIVPQKLYPLWYSPVMPLMFFLSAIAVGLAMTIFESWHSSKAFGRALEGDILQGLARALIVAQGTYVVARIMDLNTRHAWGLLTRQRTETYLFLFEAALMVLPVMLLLRERIRTNPTALYWCALMVIFGFIANRLNISVTGMEAASGVNYLPKWSEITVTLFIIGLGFGIFYLVAKHLPVFTEGEEPAH